MGTPDLRLELPPGLTLDAPPVRTSGGEVAWRIRADEPGDHVLRIHTGGAVVEKGLAVGGESRRVPVLRTQGWEKILYPGEAPLDSGSPLTSIALTSPGYPERDLGWIPGGELGIVLVFFVLSIVAAFALKGPFGVTL